MTNQTKNSMLLMLCALIWGTAFVAQSAGSGMGAFSFPVSYTPLRAHETSLPQRRAS